MKSLKFSNALLCDYVAQGHANKHVLVNVISGDVIVGEMPAELSFGLFLEMIAQDGQGPDSKLELVLNGELLFAAQGIARAPGGAVASYEEGKHAVLALSHFAFAIEKDALLEVYVSSSGFKRTLALRKNIRKGELPPNV